MILFCLFFVKLYAIYFVRLEAWNVKHRAVDYQPQVGGADGDNEKVPSAGIAIVNVGDPAKAGQVADGSNNSGHELIKRPINGT